jgi:hypothetical protein
MKTVLVPNPTFNPAAKTLNFSAVPGFQLNRLFAVIDQTKNEIIYAVSSPGLGFTSFAANILTLEKNTNVAGFNAGNSLICVYDDVLSTFAITGSATGGITDTYHNGGTTASSLIPIQIKNTAATLYGITYTPNKVDTGVGVFPAYLKLYNTSTAPTVGGGSATVPLITICLVDGTGSTPDPIRLPAAGVAFSNGIFFAITAGPSDADATPPTGGHVLNITYL